MSYFLKKVHTKEKILASFTQRGILVVTAGHEDWEPTQNELENLADMFIKASDDPQGAVVAVRRGVKVDFIPL